MFEIGQPMHAFDVDKLASQKIIVRQAYDGEKITTLDNKEVNLNNEVTVIADEKEVLAIAGIKGGKKAEVDLNTKNIILEAANFNSTSIRKNSKKLGVATESSRRFENQITPELAEKGINMALELIKKYASTPETKIYKNIEYYPKPIKTFYSGISVSEVEKLLGLEIKEENIKKSFEALRFEYEILNPEKNILDLAQSLVGKKYKWGASISYDSPELFDCSSFTAFVYSRSGVILPRITADQFVYGDEITSAELLPGDLIFSINPDDMEHGIHFETKEFLPGTKIEGGVDHVGIYLGEGKIIHATNWNDSGVILEELSQSQRFKNIVGYRRYYNDNENRFVVKIPNERLDLINIAGKFEMKQVDLIEEVGRLIGYDLVLEAPIKIENYKPETNKEYYLNNVIRLTLMNLGFSEIMTYSFVEKGELMPEKPLAEDKKYIRADLLTGMNLALENNIKYADLLNIDRVKVFEIGKVFKRNYSESLMLSLGVKNKAGLKNPKPSDLIKEAVLKLQEDLKSVGLEFLTTVEINDTAESIQINLGELYEFMDGHKTLEKTYQKLPELGEVKFKTISTYPFIARDIAVWIPKDNNINELIEIIKKHGAELLANEPRCFDVYEKEGKVSCAYRMVFQSYEKTLTDLGINEIMEKIYTDVRAKVDWEIR
jgi:phenylalanyl-tRNA synthetase beta subunit